MTKVKSTFRINRTAAYSGAKTASVMSQILYCSDLPANTYGFDQDN